ncbi:Annexin A7 [Leucoagaricus sp. SymC.cos]|nr:Annexin A7 [Leucoagaricus sp. SymC.cos]
MTSEGYQTIYTQPLPQGSHASASPIATSPGAYPPPTGQPPIPQPHVQIPHGAPGFPGATSPGFPVAAVPVGTPYQPAYHLQHQPAHIYYNGVLVPNPDAPLAAHGMRKVANYDPQTDFEVLKSAKKGGTGMLGIGSGWNDTTLMKMLTERNILEIDALADDWASKTGQMLADYLPSKTAINSWFYEVIHALALGPLGYDVELARRATIGVGTDESLLMELLLNRSNSDIEILKRAYTKRYGSNLTQEVKGDLSNATKAMYSMALMAQRPQQLPGQVDYMQVEKDVDDLNAHGLGKGTKFDEIFFCQVFVNRSDPHIAAMIDRYGQKYKSLSKVIKSVPAFSKDMKQGLLYIIHGVKSKRNRTEPFGTWRDAKLLEKAMAGAGTNDKALVYRIVRASWNLARMKAIKECYRLRYGQELEKRVKGETSGNYKTIMTQLVAKAR